MAISGSTDFDRTRNEIVTAALSLLGVYAAGETISSEDVADASVFLNMMVKAWNADGIHLWKQSEITLFCEASTNSYSLTTSNCTASYVETALSADAASSDTALTVDSISGISNGDYLGIVLDDNTIHWTTVSGAPSGSTVTAATGLASAASSGNAVYAYTTKVGKPLRIRNIRRKTMDGTEVFMGRNGDTVSRTEYMSYPNKTATGAPVQAYYDPRISTGTLFVWPSPDTDLHRIVFTGDLLLEDFDAIANTPDFPSEWLEAIVFNLAVRLGPTYGLVMTRDKPDVVAMAAQFKDNLLNWDREPASVMFQPDYD
jgi:hypothetical protein